MSMIRNGFPFRIDVNGCWADSCTFSNVNSTFSSLRRFLHADYWCGRLLLAFARTSTSSTQSGSDTSTSFGKGDGEKRRKQQGMMELCYDDASESSFFKASGTAKVALCKHCDCVGVIIFKSQQNNIQFISSIEK